MAKKYTYTDKTGKIIFETVKPNHVSIDTVDNEVKTKTGRDPRLELIDRKIRAVPDAPR